jgi:FKBP-type peptidyl-prolyl cis-trans isomerase (trigger factor)
MTKTQTTKTKKESATATKASSKTQAAPKTKVKQEQEKKSLIANNDSLRITIKWGELEKPYRSAMANFAKNMKVEGFRQGKVPLDIAEKQVSLEKIAETVLRELLPKKYIAALKETKKQPITAPEYHLVSIKKGEDWILEAHFCEAPVIELKDYEKYLATGKKAADKFIKEHNDKAKKETAKTDQKKEKKAEDNKSEQAPQAQKLSQDQEKEIYYQHILRELVVNIRPSIGELLLRRETQAEFEKLKEQLNSYKIAIEDYLKQRSISLEELSNELAGTVLNRLQIDFILAAIAKDRQIKVEESALKEALNEIKDEKLREQISNNEQYLGSFKAQLLRRQTIENLLSK